MTAILDIREVRKSYGAHQALKGVSLAVKEGEFVALVGPFFGRIRLRFALHQEKTPLLANVRERKMVADAGLRSAPRGTPGVYP